MELDELCLALSQLLAFPRAEALEDGLAAWVAPHHDRATAKREALEQAEVDCVEARPAASEDLRVGSLADPAPVKHNALVAQDSGEHRFDVQPR
jgi:hypothetical protein